MIWPAWWWTLTMMSFTPKVRRRAMVISSSARPLISTRALGRSLVSGRRRVPSPAARIMAFMGPSRLGLALKEFGMKILQAEVTDYYFDAGFAAEAFGHLFGQVHGAVLAAGAAEGDHQILEAALLIA